VCACMCMCVCACACGGRSGQSAVCMCGCVYVCVCVFVCIHTRVYLCVCVSVSVPLSSIMNGNHSRNGCVCMCVIQRARVSGSVSVLMRFLVSHQCLNHRPLYIRTPTIPLCLFKFLKTCTAASQHSKFSSELISEKLPRGHWPSSPLFCIYIYIYACRYNADVSLCTCIHKPIWGGYD